MLRHEIIEKDRCVLIGASLVLLDCGVLAPASGTLKLGGSDL